jgi:hypothetical protein
MAGCKRRRGASSRCCQAVRTGQQAAYHGGVGLDYGEGREGREGAASRARYGTLIHRGFVLPSQSMLCSGAHVDSQGPAPLPTWPSGQ